MKTYIISLVVIVFAVVIIFITMNKNKTPDVVIDPVVVTTPAVLLFFTWRYEDAGEDKFGLIQTRVFVDATYQDGKKVSKNIGEVGGSCNTIDASKEDTDMLAGTTKVQCYAAGLGYWFKIVQGDESYMVLRKMFEEAVPEEAPPQYPWETVAEF